MRSSTARKQCRAYPRCRRTDRIVREPSPLEDGRRASVAGSRRRCSRTRSDFSGSLRTTGAALPADRCLSGPWRKLLRIMSEHVFGCNGYRANADVTFVAYSPSGWLKRHHSEAPPHVKPFLSLRSADADGVAGELSGRLWNSRLGRGGCVPCVRNTTRPSE